MKKLTKKQKNQVYKLALSYLIYPNYLKREFMCDCIGEALNKLFDVPYDIRDKLMKEQFTEFYQNKPKNTMNYIWWQDDEQGRQKRIKYLVKMIKLTS